MRSIEQKILSRIYGTGMGSVVTPNAFFDLGTRAAIDQGLSRLVAKERLRRLARGIYYYPKTDPVLGELLPSPKEITDAIAAQHQVKLQPAGAYAANLLGLTEQVPARMVFLTDGSSRILRIGPTEIRLRHSEPRNMKASGRLSGLLIQAFRYLGKAHIEPQHIEHLRRTIPADERRRLIRDLRFAPEWMHPIMRQLALEEDL